MAKIAFSYLASQAGASFVLKEEFDSVRKFIRYGRGLGTDFVTPTDTALLFEEQGEPAWSITNDHLVAVERRLPDGLLGRVSLFNLVHHEIILAHRNPEVVHLSVIPSGRRFSWKTGIITVLRGWEKDNLVQPADALAPRRPHKL